MNLFRLLPLFALCLLLSSRIATAQQTELATFQLQHREATDISAILRPMLDPRGSISASGYLLIVRSTLPNLQELAQLVHALDTPLQSLIITVRRDQLDAHDRQGIGVTANGDMRIYRSRQHSDGRGEQRVRVLEGQWALIETGLDIPVPQRSTVHDGSTVSVQESIEYRSLDSGFEVRPRLHGDRITMDIRPYQAGPAADGGGAIATGQLITTVSGRLGEWIELGSSHASDSGRDRGILYSTREREVMRLPVYVRAELPAALPID